MKTTTIIFTGLLGLALLSGCEKSEQNTETGSAPAAAAPAASQPAAAAPAAMPEKPMAMPEKDMAMPEQQPAAPAPAPEMKE
ncbi:MAG: hypothetical protein CTY29_01160 [Methylobacter sp.]|nr:MAG: hypothetical protein CTY29_01160 [Methylobacter sp.]